MIKAHSFKLPLDVNEDSSQPEEFSEAMKQSSHTPASPSSSLTLFIHMLRLKRIVSEIQHTIYRVDKAVVAPDDAINAFIHHLQDWRRQIPDDIVAHDVRNRYVRRDILSICQDAD